MIKFLIKKYTSNGSGGFSNVESKKVKKRQLKEYLDKGWILSEKFIPIITPFTKWWNKFTTNQKIGIIAIIVPLFFGGLKLTIDTYLNHKYPSLKKEFNSLNDKYHLLQENCSDSITTLNEQIETISQELKSKTSSDKNQADKKVVSD